MPSVVLAAATGKPRPVNRSLHALALLSRENTLVLPALVLAYHYAFRRRVRLSRFLPLLAVALLYVLLRATVVDAPLMQGPSDHSPLKAVPGMFVALTEYLRLLILPIGLHMSTATGLSLCSTRER